MDFSKPFETFKETAFRLEALPQYLVENEKKAFQEFKSTGTIQENPHSNWSEIVKSNTGAGKSMKRLRLISDELTLYEEFELQAYPGIQHGEDIRVNARSIYGKDFLFDFWFFDNEYIAQMNYETDGTFINSDIRRASGEEKEMFSYWLGIFETSNPLE